MKLPGFFNKEIYDFLDVAVFAMWAVPLALLTTIIDADDGKHYEIMAVAEKDNGDDKEETVFDSSQQAPAKMVYTILNNLESSKLTRVEKRNKWKASPNPTRQLLARWIFQVSHDHVVSTLLKLHIAVTLLLS